MKAALKVFGITASIFSSLGSLITFNDYSRALFMEKAFGIKETQKLTDVEIERLKQQAEKADLKIRIAELEADNLKIRQEKAEEEANQLKIKQAESEKLQQQSIAIETSVETSKIQNLSTEIARLQQETTKKDFENEQLKINLDESKNNTLQIETKQKADLSPKLVIEQLIYYSSKNAGIDYENEIQQLIEKLNAFPKPPKGNIEDAKKLNNRGLLSLSNHDYNNAIQLFF
jgi:hypothetical protein